MAKTLSLRGRFVVWTSAVVIASTLGLMVSVYLVSSRALKAQSGEEMDQIVAKTAEELDLWIDSRERDAVNLSELPVVGRRLHGAQARRGGTGPGPNSSPVAVLRERFPGGHKR